MGWVVTPGEPDELAKTISDASFSCDIAQAGRAAEVATHFSFARAMASYSELIQELRRGS
jgi:colanic acid biosynthesis glycosyl transferase WcaI